MDKIITIILIVLIEVFIYFLIQSLLGITGTLIYGIICGIIDIPLAEILDDN